MIFKTPLFYPKIQWLGNVCKQRLTTKLITLHADGYRFTAYVLMVYR